MRRTIPTPTNLSASNRILHFKGIQPSALSWTLVLYLEGSQGDRQEIGQIHSYGFGGSLDQVFEKRTGPDKLTSAPPYDVFVEMSEPTVEQLIADSPASIIYEIFDSDNTLLPDEEMVFSEVTARAE